MTSTATYEHVSTVATVLDSVWSKLLQLEIKNVAFCVVINGPSNSLLRELIGFGNRSLSFQKTSFFRLQHAGLFHCLGCLLDVVFIPIHLATGDSPILLRSELAVFDPGLFLFRRLIWTLLSFSSFLATPRWPAATLWLFAHDSLQVRVAHVARPVASPCLILIAANTSNPFIFVQKLLTRKLTISRYTTPNGFQYSIKGKESGMGVHAHPLSGQVSGLDLTGRYEMTRHDDKTSSLQDNTKKTTHNNNTMTRRRDDNTRRQDVKASRRQGDHV